MTVLTRGCCASDTIKHTETSLIQQGPKFLSFPPPPLPLLFSDSSYVVALLGLVRPPLPAGVGAGAGRLRSVPVLPRARAAGCP